MLHACARVGASYHNDGNEQLLNLSQAKVDQLEIDAIGDELIRGIVNIAFVSLENSLELAIYCCTRILRKTLF